MNYFETDDFIFVHGGINPDVSPAAEAVKTLQWVSLEEASPHVSGRTVICGHTMQGTGSIADLDRTICIDTGLTQGKFLICLDLHDFSFRRVRKPV